MGEILIKPKVVVDDIVLQEDTNNKHQINNLLYIWGKEIPIIKINDYVVSPMDIIHFNLEVGLNKIPTFSIHIDDNRFHIRENLKNDIDICTIFFGWQTWYIKFNGLIQSIRSNFQDTIIYLNGIVFNEKLFEQSIKSYTSDEFSTIADILKDICEQSDMGLFSFNNSGLSRNLSEISNPIINPNTNTLEFFNNIITNYSDDNIYMIDQNYYFHVGNYETIIKEPVDKYTISIDNGSKINETDIILISIDKNIEGDKNFSDSLEKEQPMIQYLTHTLNSSFSDIFYNKSYKEYSIIDENFNETSLTTDINVGIGKDYLNCFSEFSTHKNPFYKDRINKILGGKTLIKVKLKNIIYEITPFTLVDFRAYTYYSTGKEIVLDEEHSGKKMCIGYRFIFNRNKDKSKNIMYQELDLI